MLEILPEDNDKLVTLADLKAFLNEFTRQLNDDAPSPFSPAEGAEVLADEIIELHSEDVAEDGRVLRIYALRGGRTGAQCFAPGADPGPIKFC